MSRLPCYPDGNIYSGNSKREGKGKKKKKTVHGSLFGSKLSYFIQRMLLQMIEDTPTKGGGEGGTPILMGARTHSGRDRVRAVGVRGEGLEAGDERPSPPDSNLKGPAEMGVDISREGLRTRAHLKNVSLESMAPWQGEPLKIRPERGR